MVSRKNSKKTSVFQKFNGLNSWKLIAIFCVVFGLVGGLILYKSFAATTIHQYTYVSPTLHNIGSKQRLDLEYGSTHLGERDVWAVSKSQINGKYMWYGPKVSIYSSYSYLQACWYYISPHTQGVDVTFDVYHGNGKYKLFSTDLSIYAYARRSDGRETLHKYCAKIRLNNTITYTGFEMRVRPNYLVNSADTFWVYKTSWQLL